MTDVWVCTNCKSINRQRDTRCYSCGQRQEEAAAAAAEAPNVRLAEAVAQRRVMGYTPSWPFAVAAGGLTVVVAIMGLWLVLESLRSADLLRELFVAAIRTGDDAVLTPLLAEQQRLASPSLMRAGLLLLAVVAFGLWLSRVRLNIPALGGGVPEWGPIKALLYPLIPIVNIVRVPVFVQDALYRLDPRAGGFMMVLFAFLLFVGSSVVGFVGSIAISGAFVTAIVSVGTEEGAIGAFRGLLDQTMALTVITELMTAGGALLLVIIIARVESRAQARNREIQAAIVGDPTQPADPDATGSAGSPGPAGATGWATPVPAPTTASVDMSADGRTGYANRPVPVYAPPGPASPADAPVPSDVDGPALPPPPPGP